MMEDNKPCFPWLVTTVLKNFAEKHSLHQAPASTENLLHHLATGDFPVPEPGPASPVLDSTVASGKTAKE